jgi:GNAT superfamily N-acetyltransferase
MQHDSARLERVAQRFRRDIWRSVPSDAVTESGVEVKIFGPVQATAFGDLPEATCLNQIQGAAEPGAIEGGHLGDAVEWMRSREVDYRVPVADDRPGAAEAEAWLGSRGLERGASWFKMVRDGSPPELFEDPAVTIYELGQEEGDGEGLSSIAAEALELPITAGTLFFSVPECPDWRCYTAAVDAEEGVVSTGFMLIDGEVAQLGVGTTLEHARGRGCNTALIRRRLLDAAAAGCHTVFAELGERDPSDLAAAHRNLRRAGFQIVSTSQNWQHPALHPAEVFDY